MQDCPHCGMMLTPKLGLTPRMQQMLDYIEMYIESHGFSPTYREIAAGIGLTSTSFTYRTVRQLEERGHIMTKSGARSITVI
jgi:SOS-response transcriptional repressor LexA